jgi:hypothetical protein
MVTDSNSGQQLAPTSSQDRARYGAHAVYLDLSVFIFPVGWDLSELLMVGAPLRRLSPALLAAGS